MSNVYYCHRCQAHTLWEELKRGSTRERCVNCNDVFPCRTACKHFDCMQDRGEDLPAGVTDASFK